MRPRHYDEPVRNNIFPDQLARRVVDGNLLYAPVVSFDLGTHTLLMVSGLLARDGAGTIIGIGDMGQQLRQVGENLRTSLQAAGADLYDLVRTCTYVTDIDEFFQHTSVRQEFLGVALPTSTTVEVRRLSHPDFMVEIEAMAIIPSSRLIKEKS
jgi:2-iminobutanoate/2-iminopropanoate deaminase